MQTSILIQRLWSSRGNASTRPRINAARPEIGSVGKHALFRMGCIVTLFCTATAITSRAAETPTVPINSVYDFPRSGADGASPRAPLIQASDGSLYGTTPVGGDDGTCFQNQNCVGAIFKLTQGQFTLLYTFGPDPSKHYSNGANPSGGLVEGPDGYLYGVTTNGGSVGYGVVYKISKDGQQFQKLYDFCGAQGCSDGGNPVGSLVVGGDGNLYGTTTAGGSFGPCSGKHGTIYRIATDGTSFTKLADGSAASCSTPTTGLVLASNGNFYGGTGGVIFSLTRLGGLTIMYTFGRIQQDGSGGVTAPLIQAADGNLYGTTYNGGAHGAGIVFKISTSGNYQKVFDLNQPDTDVFPFGVIQASDGNLWGTTCCLSGANVGGAVFTITTGGTLVESTFLNNQTGIGPVAPLIQASDGKLYGTTTGAGTGSNGTVFVVDAGLGGGPIVTLSRTSLGFGSVVVNTTSAAKSVTVTNTGSATLDISSITASTNFAISANTCGPTLSPGKSCKVSVTFTPTKLGKVTGTLAFTDNAPDSPQSVALSGTGVLPATLKPAKATYAAQTVGTTSPPKTFTLTNNQTVTLSSIVISITGDFAVSGTTCSTSLAPKSKCTISVTFTPTQTGTRTGQLSVSDSANNSPQKSSLTGTGQ
jgi:uncharacterized repeat protein (TIGR03803 family)